MCLSHRVLWKDACPLVCAEIKPIGRNTQGVRIMRLGQDDTLAAIVCVPPDENGDDDEVAGSPTAPINGAVATSADSASPNPESHLSDQAESPAETDTPESDSHQSNDEGSENES